MVIAFAGRRIDPPAADKSRFPPANERMVAHRLRHRFQEMGARAFVGSAACGADLLGHDVARELGLHSVVVLPWNRTCSALDPSPIVRAIGARGLTD